MSRISTLTTVEPDRMRALRANGEFFWLDLIDPTAAELQQVGSLLDWHPLMIEDLEHGEQRPKIDDFEDHSLVITYATLFDTSDRSFELLEHALVVHGDYLVTVRRTDHLDLRHLCDVLSHEDQLTEAGVVHRVLDMIVDTTVEAAGMLADDVEQLEVTVMKRPDDDAFQELRRLRREGVAVHAAAVAQRDAMTSLSTGLERIPGFEVGMRDHFRDVTDHARRAVDQLEISRSLLQAAFDAYYASLVAKQGAIAQRLSVVATIFLPLTFVTGFFGQNFGWMVEHVSSERDFYLFGVGSCAITGLVLLYLFRRLRWL
jgi:magnesium transporter